MIEFSGVHKRFGEQEVLRGVDLRVGRGAVHFVIGLSGAGKSVLIRHLVGLVKPDAGSVRFDGAELAALSEPEFYPVRRRCQMIFQHASLFAGLTVLDNIAMPARKRFNLSRAEAAARARAALEDVHAAHLAERFPSELGAGVQKRISIARALALKPEAMLYDEPTTSLDPVNARRTDWLIATAARDFGLTSVVVSHDLASVRAIAQRVTLLAEGRAHFTGSVDELFASADPVVRRFVTAGAN